MSHHNVTILLRFILQGFKLVGCEAETLKEKHQPFLRGLFLPGDWSHTYLTPSFYGYLVSTRFLVASGDGSLGITKSTRGDSGQHRFLQEMYCWVGTLVTGCGPSRN